MKDAHGSGRNIRQEELPPEVTLVRGWSGHPYAMVQEIDPTFDAVAMIGYHGPASDPQNPLSHTYSGSWNHITLNGSLCPEYWLYAHCAALEGVPVVFVSGDAGICKPHDHCLESLWKTQPGIFFSGAPNPTNDRAYRRVRA